MNLKKSFLEYCEKEQFEINQNQIDIIDDLKNFYEDNFKKNFLTKILKKNNKLGFYLVGEVGVGKTMILNFFFNELKEKKLRLHFNEFMINFHDFIFKNKNKKNGLDEFVNNLNRKTKLIYFDEFQVTNIVDAMILGRLFKKIFEKKISVIFSSNINIMDLYKDGLQRDQFIPFIEILKNYSLEKELLIKDDYRLNNKSDPDRFLSPLDKSNNFILNKFLRKITKNKNQTSKTLDIKGRKVEIKIFFEGVAKFKFDELCNRNLGSEDYIKIVNCCNFIFIENLPKFDTNNSNQQQRFITLVDIIYEKKVPLMVTSEQSLDIIKASENTIDTFKRTISRLYELTSMNYETSFL